MSSLAVTHKMQDMLDRQYQLDAATNTLNSLEKKRDARILISAPTGTGKTHIAKGILVDDAIIDLLLEGKEDRKTLRVMFKSHRHRLLTQAERTFSEHEYISEVTTFEHWLSGKKGKTRVEIMYCTLGTEIPEGVEVDVIMIDEAHHEACMTYQVSLNSTGKIPCIGFTATPDRPDGMLIKFDFYIEVMSRLEAVKRGLICETDIKSIIDVGDKDKYNLVRDIIDFCGDEFGQTIIYLRTKKEVAKVTRMLQDRGYSAHGILYEIGAELDAILDAFSNGEYQFLVNAQKLSEGIDLKGCTDVLIARTIGSYTLLNQIIGRAARPDDPRCVVWELINPMSGKNLDSLVVVVEAKSRELIFKKGDVWERMDFGAAANEDDDTEDAA